MHCFKITPATAMLHIRLISTLLLAAVFLPLISVVFSETSITCVEKNSIHRLSCDIGVIRVQAALYGRRNRRTCNEGKPRQQLANTRCSARDTLQRIKARCDNRKLCELNKNDLSRSDPCRGTFKYVETTYICLPAIHDVACENSMAFLFCDEGQVIDVYGARFGRGNKDVCAYRLNTRLTRNVWCSNPTNKVKQKCNGKTTCSIRASKSVFGDPCRKTYKYLEVAYVCQYPSI